MKKILVSPFFVPTFFALVWLSWVCVLFVFGYDNLPYILEEHGPLEIVTHWAYAPLLLTFLATAYYFIKNNQKLDFALFVLFGITAFLRELGAQHWLASRDTTAFKSRFFLNPNNPLSEKIIAGAILIALVAIIIYLAKKYGKHLVVSFFKMNATTWSVATLCTFGIFGKIIDRLPANYRKANGVSLPEQMEINLKIIEETSETMLPLIAAAVLLQYVLIGKNKQN